MVFNLDTGYVVIWCKQGFCSLCCNRRRFENACLSNQARVLETREKVKRAWSFSLREKKKRENKNRRRSWFGRWLVLRMDKIFPIPLIHSISGHEKGPEPPPPHTHTKTGLYHTWVACSEWMDLCTKICFVRVLGLTRPLLSPSPPPHCRFRCYHPPVHGNSFSKVDVYFGFLWPSLWLTFCLEPLEEQPLSMWSIIILPSSNWGLSQNFRTRWTQNFIWIASWAGQNGMKHCKIQKESNDKGGRKSVDPKSEKRTKCARLPSSQTLRDAGWRRGRETRDLATQAKYFTYSLLLPCTVGGGVLNQVSSSLKPVELQ